MTTGLPKPGWSLKRSTVNWNVDRPSNSGNKCFGIESRDAGHSLVPAPPHMMVGLIIFDSFAAHLPQRPHQPW
jgi:hypothetical protein